MSLRNPTFNQLAQAAHAGVAAAIVFTASTLGGREWQLISTVLITVYGIAKEFWLDIKYERPDVSGGWRGGLIDYTFYLVGLVYANSILLIKGGL